MSTYSREYYHGATDKCHAIKDIISMNLSKISHKLEKQRKHEHNYYTNTKYLDLKIQHETLSKLYREINC